MRRTQFITAVIVAALTFFALQAFVGYRYWGRYGWRGGYNRQGNYYAPNCDGYYRDYYNNDKNSQRIPPSAPQRDSVR